MCLCVLFVSYCVLLYDVVLVVVRVCVRLMCLLDVLMLNCVLVSGLCLCCAVVMRVGFDAFVRVVCDLLCDVV